MAPKVSSRYDGRFGIRGTDTLHKSQFHVRRLSEWAVLNKQPSESLQLACRRQTFVAKPKPLGTNCFRGIRKREPPRKHKTHGIPVPPIFPPLSIRFKPLGNMSLPGLFKYDFCTHR